MQLEADAQTLKTLLDMMFKGDPLNMLISEAKKVALSNQFTGQVKAQQQEEAAAKALEQAKANEEKNDEKDTE